MFKQMISLSTIHQAREKNIFINYIRFSRVCKRPLALQDRNLTSKLKILQFTDENTYVYENEKKRYSNQEQENQMKNNGWK